MSSDYCITIFHSFFFEYTGNVDSSSRVYGGEIISEFEFPFVLSFQRLNVLLNRWEHICGASLIQPEWALISANCLNKSVLIITKRIKQTILLSYLQPKTIHM